MGKARVVCGNPLFLEWAEEVYEDAEKKEMRAAQTFKRACNSIRSCPIVFATPRDLISLAGVGPGLVGKLEKKFKDHCQAKGIPVPAGVEGNGAVLRETPSGAAAKKRKDTSGENEPVAQAPPKKTKSTSTAKAPKTYIPRPRSGAYAILLALMTSVPDEYQRPLPLPPRNLEGKEQELQEWHENQEYLLRLELEEAKLTKSEVINAGRKHCDSDFEKSETGGFHTAWASMKTLIGKSLVNQRGSPNRFSLTIEGWKSALAVKKVAFPNVSYSPRVAPDSSPPRGLSDSHRDPLRKRSRLDPPSSPPVPVKKSTKPDAAWTRSADETIAAFGLGLGASRASLAESSRAKPTLAKSNRLEDLEPTARTLVKPKSKTVETNLSSKLNQLKFCYMDKYDHPVRNRYQALPGEDPELSMPRRKIRIEAKELSHPAANQLRHMTQAMGTTEGGIMFDGWLLDMDAPDKSTWMPVDPPVAGSSTHAPSSPILNVDKPERRPLQPVKTTQVSTSLTPAANDFDSLWAEIEGERSKGSSSATLATASASLSGPTKDRVGQSTESRPKPRPKSKTNDAPPILDLPPSSPPIPITSSTSALPSRIAAPNRRLVPTSSDSVISCEPHPTALETRPKGAAAMLGRNKAPLSRFESMPVTRLEHDITLDPHAPPPFDKSSAIIYPPGSYSVILVLDNREVKNTRDQDAVTNGLSSKGIVTETRPLKLGDAAWVAKLKPGYQTHLRGEERECVLDYVVERKRLDDLVSSIRDGRYDDQKYRLTQSCLGHVYYVVEDWDIERAYQRPDSSLILQIATAKSQTQIVNGFFLKATHKLSETIDFLRILTENIQEALDGQSLHIIPPRYVSRTSFTTLKEKLNVQHPSLCFHTTYETFQAMNGKNANQTTSGIWARMLLCIRGMSPEKVGAFLRCFPTAHAFWQVFVKKEAEWKELSRKAEQGGGGGVKKPRDLQLFFADHIPGEGRQKIGDALSRELFSVLCT